MPSVTVITPWRNHPEFVDGYLEAIDAGQPDHFLIVDDNSDPPLEFADVWLKGHSHGFCSACNAGLAAAGTDAVVFLNNDIQLVRANWLREIRALLKPRTLVGELRTGSHTHVDGREHPYIDGWCIAAMREDLLELGGWDDTLEEPAYYSDNMLTLRALEAGWDVSTLNVGLHHLVSGTAKDNPSRIHQAAQANRAKWVQAVTDSKLVTT